MKLYRSFTQDYPRPIITEMGGKNPAIVTRNADLDEAAEGVMRSAFGYDGQKCSANSRVYVEKSVAREFVDKLVSRTREITVGDPTRRENWMGPVINQRALDTFTTAIDDARADGGTIEVGGEVLRDGDTERGFFPTPTVVTGLPLEHRLFRDELFVPFLVVGEVDSLDQALEESNASAYGLTAGIFSHDEAEVRRFLDTIQAGRRLREPAGGRHDRRVAGDPELRRLEGLGLVRQERARARTTSSSSCASSRRPSSPTRSRPSCEREGPMIERFAARRRGRDPRRTIRMVRGPAALRLPRRGSGGA